MRQTRGVEELVIAIIDNLKSQEQTQLDLENRVPRKFQVLAEDAGLSKCRPQAPSSDIRLL